MDKNNINKPRVAVLIATYNGEKYIEEQVNSILNQEGVEVEILIRDDGSIDNTISILDELSRNPNVSWYTGDNLGSASSFMDLLRNAPIAKYYAFSDQDDYWYKNKLISGITNIEESESLLDQPTLYYTGLEIVDENLNYLGEHIVDNKRNYITGFIRSNVSGCVAILNNALKEKVNQYRPNYIDMHDNWIYKVCVAVGGNIIINPQPSIKHRQHGHNARGLDNNINNKVKKAKYFIFDYKLKPQVQNIINGYEGELLPEYKELIHLILNYDKSLGGWYKLFTFSEIDFRNRFLNALFKIKVLLRQV